MAEDRVGENRSTQVRVDQAGPAELALLRFAFMRNAPLRFALLRSAPLRSAELRFALLRSVPIRLAPARSGRTRPDPRSGLIVRLWSSLHAFQTLLGTMVQEAYDTHPAIREACDRYISEHAERLEADIAEAKALYAPAAEWSPASAALFSQAVLQGAFILAKAKPAQKSPPTASII